MLSGGAYYAVYITTSYELSGSLSGAPTREAKSWGEIKDDSDAVTVWGCNNYFSISNDLCFR
jgi:deoxyhypusine synthase